MTEYGVFNDEGLVSGQFYSESEAAAYADEIAEGDPGEREALTVAKVCPDHTDQPDHACEDCARE